MGFQFAGVLPGTEAADAIIVRKGDHKLRTEINSALEEIENDGASSSMVWRRFKKMNR